MGPGLSRDASVTYSPEIGARRAIENGGLSALEEDVYVVQVLQETSGQDVLADLHSRPTGALKSASMGEGGPVLGTQALEWRACLGPTPSLAR